MAEKISTGQMREMSEAELVAKISELEHERHGLRFKAGTEVLANPMDLRKARRTAARLRTILAERRRAARTTA
ncbi:MAG: 50S ribosomal protein L29 [Gemmatimonadales bacterium]